MPLIGRPWCVLLSLITLGALAPAASSQTSLGPDEQCSVQILNRTVRVEPDGSWRLTNIPVMGNRVRARLVCDDGVVVRRGEGPLMQLSSSGTYALAPIAFGPANPAPTGMVIGGVEPIVTSTEDVQLTITGLFASGSQDVTASDSGTDYFTTDTGVLTVSADGLLTPQQSGVALITVTNQGVTAGVQVRVELGADTDGDGLPDDWENANGLDPTDPTDALVDSDADNLTNRTEYICGTDPFDVDTDGDTLGDGDEVSEVVDDTCVFLSDPRLRDSDGDLVPDQIELLTGTSPTNAQSFDLDAALLELRITPGSLSMPIGTLLNDSLAQVTLTGILLDGSGIDLTIHPQVAWLSASPQIADLTANPGQILAQAPGETTILAGVGSHEAEVLVGVVTFTPRALGMVVVEGRALNVDLSGGLAYLSTDIGLSVITASPGSAPELVSELDLPGWGYEDIKVRGTVAYLAGELGVAIVDVANPAVPVQVGQHDVTWAVDLDLLGDDHIVVAATDTVVVVDVSDPAVPVQVGSVSAGGTVQGVAVDGDAGIVALGFNGVAGLSLADPTSPTLSGAVGIAGQASDVDLADGVAVVAASVQGLATVDMSDPSSPVHLVTGGAANFKLYDVALDGDLALGADIFRVNDVPIVNVADPVSPVFNALVDFSSFGGLDGTGLDAQGGVVAVATGSRFVLVGLYAVPVDDAGVPPVAVLTSPTDGQLFVEGEVIPLIVAATDDVAVDRVEYFADGQLLGVRVQAPFTYGLQGLAADTVTTLHAEAVDLAGSRGDSAAVTVAVITDPLTTVVGRVVDAAGLPVADAEVSLLDLSQTGTTDAAGTFTFQGVPTIKDVQVVAEKALPFTCVAGDCGEVFTACTDGQPCDAPYTGVGGPLEPVRAGVTDLGDILLEATSRSTVMAGIVSAPWTFQSFEEPTGGPEVTEMTGVVSAPWTFQSFDLPVGGSAVTEMAGVVSAPWTFQSFDTPQAGVVPSFMAGVVSAPWTFQSFDVPESGVVPSLMAGVVSAPWTFESEDEP